MKENYLKIEVTKRELEVIRFLQTGSNQFWDSFYNYFGRKKRIDRPTLQIATWFNSTIKRLHQKGLFKEIPFAYAIKGGFIWANPGINASKANFECITIQDQFQESKMKFNHIL